MMFRTLTVPFFVAISIVFSAISWSAQAEKSNTTNRSITVARLPLSMYAINGALIEAVAEAKGFSVEFLDGVHADLFPAVANGDADILASIWLPYGHKSYWETHGDQYITLGAIFQNGSSFFVVPDYVDPDIRSVGDLVKLTNAARFSKIIPSIHKGTSMYEKSVAVVDDYGLNNLGFVVEAGTPQSWEAALDKAIKEEAWIVFPLWEPQYMNRAYPVRRLSEPAGIFGGREATFLVANRAWARNANPDLISALSRINVSLNDLNELDYAVNVSGLSAREAVDAFLKSRPGLLASWAK